MHCKSLCYGILQFIYSIAITIFLCEGRKDFYFSINNFSALLGKTLIAIMIKQPMEESSWREFVSLCDQ